MEDRTISLNAVIKAVDKHTNDDGTLDDEISCILEDIPSAEPYKGMTNEEVIKTVFPKAVLHTEYDDVYLSFQQGVYLQDKDTTWLNAPYKVEPEDQNNG